jgi:hypothetical protein
MSCSTVNAEHHQAMTVGIHNFSRQDAASMSARRRVNFKYETCCRDVIVPNDDV